MSAAAPIIYSRMYRPSRAGWSVRLLSLATAGACLALLITAASLAPSRAGFGTHRGLHLPGCEFTARTGLPCPSCGMTTSFSWFVRGNLVASLYVQPMGTLLAALSCCWIWAGLYIGITGRPIYRLLELAPQRYLFIPLMVIGIVGWVWKIYIHLSGHDGW